MYCTYCGAEVEEDAKFCPSCGSNLNGSEKTENSFNDSSNNENKSKGIFSFLDNWNEWGAGKKVGSVLLAGCIGLIIVGAIGGILFPDLNTSEHRFYMTNSSFVIPDGCTIRESGIGAGMAILVKEDGMEVFVEDYASQSVAKGNIIDSNNTIDVDGVKVYKIKYHSSSGLSSTGYFFNKDTIDYWIRSSPGTEIDDDFVIPIVKSMDTSHGSSSDHKNLYSDSSSTNNDNDKVNRYDSYTGGSSNKANDVEVDKRELTADQYAFNAYDGTKDYTINGHKGHLYVGPYHDGGSDVDFYYEDNGKYYMLSACDDSNKALEKMEQMI